MVRGPCPRSHEPLPNPALWDMPPFISTPFFPIENSLGRRGASSRLRFARRQNRTVLRRLTGHFGRRGQSGMKTNHVSPVSPPPKHLPAVMLRPSLPPHFPVWLVSLQ